MLTCDAEPPYRNRQPEAAGTRASRIKIEHSVSHLRLWHMTMPWDDESKACRFGIQINCLQIVQNVNRESAYLEQIACWQFSCPGSAVHVPANHSKRRDCSELL